MAPQVMFAAKKGKVPASERVNLACCGIGHRGGQIVNELFKTGHANIVALCDTDMGAPHTKEILKKFPDVPRFKDFREMFDKMGNKIEAVSVGTPDKAKNMEGKLPKVPKSPSNHFKNFLLACKGEEKCRSSFAVAGPLCQTMALGVIAQWVNAKLEFDRKTKPIANHKVANGLLAGVRPRADWLQYYKR